MGLASAAIFAPFFFCKGGAGQLPYLCRRRPLGKQFVLLFHGLCLRVAFEHLIVMCPSSAGAFFSVGSLDRGFPGDALTRPLFRNIRDCSQLGR